MTGNNNDNRSEYSDDIILKTKDINKIYPGTLALQNSKST